VTAPLWVIAAATLLLATIAARAYWVWATTSRLEQLSDREVADLLRPQSSVMATPLHPPVNGYDESPVE
jgi:hypothetical protein